MDSLVIYSTQWCGYCHRLMRQLDREQISYEVIDIEEVPDGAEIVERINQGNRTVPTVVFPDGTSATNPSLSEVRLRLRASERSERREPILVHVEENP